MSVVRARWRARFGVGLAAVTGALIAGAVAAAAVDEPGAAASPSQAVAAPEAVAADYFAAMRASDFERVVTLMHPEAIERFHTMLLPIIRTILRQDQISGPIGSAFADIQSDAQLQQLPAREFFLRFLKQLWLMDANFQRAFAGSTTTMLGSVAEGPDMAHAVFRTTMTVGGTSITKVDVLSLKQSNGQWRVLLSSELEGVAEMFQKLAPRLERMQKEPAAPRADGKVSKPENGP